MLKIAYYELKKFFRNTGFMFLTVLQPIVIVTLLSFVAYRDPADIRLVAYNRNANEYSNKIIADLENQEEFNVEIYDNEDRVHDDISKNKAKMAVIVDVKKENKMIDGKIEAIGNATVPEISFISKLKFSDAIKDTITDFTKDNAQTKIDQSINEQKTKAEDTQVASLDKIKASLASIGLPAEQQAKINTALDEQKVTADFSVSASRDVPEVTIESKDNNVKETKYFDLYASAILIMIALFISLKVSDAAITEERQDGTFERFFVTPYQKYQMIGGKMIAFVFLNIITVALLLGVMIGITNIAVGALWLVFSLCLLTAISSAAIGIFISSVTYSVKESIQASNIFFFSMLITSGLLFQTESMHPYVKYLTYAIPFSYAMRVMREVNLLGMGLMDVWQDLAIIAGFTAVFIIMATLALRRKAT